MQAALKDFQAVMKSAKAKEAASLPKQPTPAQGRAAPDLERGDGEGAAEQQALLQVRWLPCSSFWAIAWRTFCREP